MRTLTFKSNGGYTEVHRTIIANDGLILFPSVTPPSHPYNGAEFLGWGFTPDDTPYTEPTININRDMTFYALWSGINNGQTVNVTFVPNGGLGNPYTLEYKYNEMGVLPTECPFTHPAGSRFIGWSTDPGSNVTKKTFLFEKNMYMYAVWENGDRNNFVGRTIPVYGPLFYACEWRTPIDSKGRILVTTPFMVPGNTWDLKNNDWPNTAAYSYNVYYNGEKENASEISDGSKYTLKHPEDYILYQVIGTNTKAVTRIWELDGPHNMEDAAAQYYVPSVRPRGNKTFLGWAASFNSGKPAYIGRTARNLYCPIFRQDNPKFTVTFDSNNSQNRQITIKNIENEILMVDATIAAMFTPDAGKMFLGLSTQKKGSPIYGDFITIKDDTVLYAIWGES